MPRSSPLSRAPRRRPSSWPRRSRTYNDKFPNPYNAARYGYIDDVIEHTFHKAGIRPEEVDAIAATSGPGLIGGVVVGVMAAKRWPLPSASRLWRSTTWKGTRWFRG